MKYHIQKYSIYEYMTFVENKMKKREPKKVNKKKK